MLTAEELIHKAFDIYCLKLYDKTYSYAENNLYRFLENMFYEYFTTTPQHGFYYDMLVYNEMFNISNDNPFYEYLLKFIQENDQRTI